MHNAGDPTCIARFTLPPTFDVVFVNPVCLVIASSDPRCCLFSRVFARRRQPASYGKKNGMWYASPGNQGWGSKALSRKASVVEAADVVSQAQAAAHSSTIKPSAGRVIRIINSLDHSVQVSAKGTRMYRLHVLNVIWCTRHTFYNVPCFLYVIWHYYANACIFDHNNQNINILLEHYSPRTANESTC